MIVQDILATKGHTTVTITPSATVADLVALLAEHGIGALVVSSDGSSVDGIVSERDVARALHRHGAELLATEVRQLMTSDVRTCTPRDTVRDIAEVMTQGRFRHLPVVDDAALAGVVSIGDVVKKRIDQLETEADQLMGYVTSS